MRNVTTWLAIVAWVWGTPVGAQLGPDRNLTLFQADVGAVDEGGDRFGDALVSCDFDGDTFLDLAIGIPDEDVGAIVDAGAVVVTHGSFAGLGLGPSQTYNQNTAGTLETAEAGDRFGATLAAGDIDNDGFCDLAIGVPGQDHGAAADAGDVHVLFGSASGLSATDDQVWHQGSPGVPDINEIDDAFGTALAIGDFDFDGFADLAIGVPSEDVGFTANAGAVTVLYGMASGLTAVGSNQLEDGTPEVDDRFGFAVAAGNATFDSADDLAIGMPGWESTMSATNAGLVRVFPGEIGLGLAVGGPAFMGNDVEEDAATGSSLAAGDFNGDGEEDFGVGRPGWTFPVDSQGQANVWTLSTGLDFVTQGRGGILETSEAFDRLGEAVAAGDFDGDGNDDLVVGVPGENLDDAGASPLLDAGLVHVVYGTPMGIEPAGNQVWSLEVPGIGDLVPRSNDRFGAALATGDFDNDGADDLAIGVPGATVGALASGVVEILYGRVGGDFSDGFESGDTSAWDVAVP